MTPLRDDPLSSKADIVTEPCQWSPNEHIHLPAPEEVFSAPVLSKKDGSVVAKVTELLVVKYGRRVFPREVAAIRYVSAHTSIPVPQIRGTYKYDSQFFFFMDFMPGRSLDEVWPEMTPAAKSILVEQLRDHYSRLKSLTGTYIGGLGRTPAFDIVFENLKSDDRGPFSSVTAFHDALYRAFKVCIDRNSPDYPAFLVRGIRRMLKDNYAVHFCHGDLKPRNVVVSEKGDLVSVLSWGRAGFWPAYWEWLKANDRAWEDARGWPSVLDSVLEPFDREYWIYFKCFQEPFP
ncbi:Protein kinase-like domain protein [Sparassis crispa]|uniref:Protein kinase-like domain protein n=1 Tax=Sparassis crispa TaxID=139825 RepID=A0A401GYN8_9APHY|nr:Protein kinase-like domain protein [Sparassis crispa]GBE87271.1 Protein kinase-like domain protein [Sparassis crispa]